MPKLLAPLTDFSAGLNTNTNERDISDTEYPQGDNVDSSVQGRLRCIGKWKRYYINEEDPLIGISDIEIDPDGAGYGLFSFPVDTDFDGDAIPNGGRYIAIYDNDKNGGTAYLNPQIRFRVQPAIDDEDEESGLLMLDAATLDAGDNNATQTSKVSYTYIDGALRVFDKNHDFAPQKLYHKDTRYFFTHTKQVDGEDDTTGIEYTVDAGWVQDRQFVKAPSEGFVHYNIVTNAPSKGSGTLPTDGTGVALVIHAREQSTSFVKGWGKSLTESSAANSHNFYATFVYDGNQESLAKYIGSAGGFGGYSSGGVDNDFTFVAVVRPRTAQGSTIIWNNRITSVRIYYNKADADQNIMYFIGDYPVSDASESEDVCRTDSEGYAYLLGEKTGRWKQDDNTIEENLGVYHETPPIIFTHAVKSGIRPETVSTECRYSTAAIINRKMYVGDVTQLTKDSPDAVKRYEDRLLKSIQNRFDVLPDSEFVDVAIRDGEKIVRLIGSGNRLLQFKERTLYVIAVAGGEEYLEAKFPDMGILHPNAVCEFPGGVFWANPFGAYIFDGQKPPTNVSAPKIDATAWATFCGSKSIVGFFPSENKLIVISDASTIFDNTDENDEAEMYYFNLATASWNKQKGLIGASDDRKAITNINNFQDTSGINHTVVFLGDDGNSDSDDGEILEYVSVDTLASSYDKNTSSTFFPLSSDFLFKTKEYTANAPHQKKRIYGCYITYKGHMIQDNTTGEGTGHIVPKVSLLVRNRDTATQETIVLDPKTTSKDFEDADDWKTAHYIVPSAERSKSRNVYGMQLQIDKGDSSDGVDTSFQINDISLIIRMKSPA